jgi:uncharacterized protein (TIGR02597 family)
MTAGEVVRGKILNWLVVNSAGKRDNYLGLQRPTTITLAESGLVSSGAFQASPAPGERTDELFVFNNATARRNKSPSETYYYWNNAWRKIGSGAANFDAAAVFTPGKGFIIRKNTSPTPGAWSSTVNY